MQATRILPDLQCSLLCEDIRQEASGNFILLGVLNFVRVPQLPVTAFKICVFIRQTDHEQTNGRLHVAPVEGFGCELADPPANEKARYKNEKGPHGFWAVILGELKDFVPAQ